MSPLATAILDALKVTPKHFHDVVDDHPGAPWRDLLRAWGELRAADILKRNETGHYYIDGGPAQSGPAKRTDGGAR